LETAKALQPFPEGALRIVETGGKDDPGKMAPDLPEWRPVRPD
jgi:hypothetical protein